MHILFITDNMPFPPISGDRIRVYQLLKRISRTHRVSIAAPIRSEEEGEGMHVLNEFCQHVLTANQPRRSPLAHLPGLFQTALSGRPLELHFLTSKKLQEKIRALLETGQVDIVQCEHSRMAHYADVLPANSMAKTLLTFHNVAAQQFDTIYKITHSIMPKFRAWLFSRQMRRWEARCVRKFDRCVTVSENDRSLLLQDVPQKHIELVANGVDIQACQPLLRPMGAPTLILIGLMSYQPYTDSAIYFCETILPLIRKAVGGVKVLVVGPNPPLSVKRLEGDGVVVTGRVPNVAPYYQEACISVVPLRAGGGTRLKILEAMAFGRPVVSTSLGCEGLNVQHEEHLLIADEPQKFAGSVVRLLQDDDLYNRIIVNARARVEAEYDWDVLAAQMLNIYDDLVKA